MLNSSAYAAHLLKRVAAGERIDPDELLAAAEGLRLAVIRLIAAKPPGRGSGVHRPLAVPGDVDSDVTLEDLAGITAVANAIAETEGRK